MSEDSTSLTYKFNSSDEDDLWLANLSIEVSVERIAIALERKFNLLDRESILNQVHILIQQFYDTSTNEKTESERRYATASKAKSYAELIEKGYNTAEHALAVAKSDLEDFRAEGRNEQSKVHWMFDFMISRLISEGRGEVLSEMYGELNGLVAANPQKFAATQTPEASWKKGLRTARKRGKLGGRPPKHDAEKIAMVKAMHQEGIFTPQEIANLQGISVSTMYRLLKKEA